MAFWDDLSPAVKRYAIVAVVLLAAILAFRACVVGGSTKPAGPTTSTRGLRGH
jgi:hypothetical protein